MKILYIWDGRHELPAWRKACIDSTMSLYPDAEYVCISQFPSFHSSRFRMVNWFDLMDQMKIRFGLKEMPFRWKDPVCFSDWARFWWLSFNPNTLYLDTDAKMVQAYDFEAETKVIHSPDNICLLYTPRGFSREPFMKLLDAQAKRYFGMLMGIHTKFNPEWARPIPPEQFRHRYDA